MLGQCSISGTLWAEDLSCLLCCSVTEIIENCFQLLLPNIKLFEKLPTVNRLLEKIIN